MSDCPKEEEEEVIGLFVVERERPYNNDRRRKVFPSERERERQCLRQSVMGNNSKKKRPNRTDLLQLALVVGLLRIDPEAASLLLFGGGSNSGSSVAPSGGAAGAGAGEVWTLSIPDHRHTNTFPHYYDDVRDHLPFDDDAFDPPLPPLRRKVGLIEEEEDRLGGGEYRAVRRLQRRILDDLNSLGRLRDELAPTPVEIEAYVLDAPAPGPSRISSQVSATLSIHLFKYKLIQFFARERRRSFFS